MAGRPLAPLIVLLLLAPASALPLAARDEPRSSITIVTDAGFAAPGSGVRSGSGTADDPYVIADWTILQTRPWGIRLEDTTAHVVIERVRLLPAPFAWATDCPTLGVGGARCEWTSGVRLVNVQNVTVRDVEIPTRWLGVQIERSRDVRLDGLRIDDDMRSGLNGIYANDSQRLTIERVHVTRYPVHVALVRVDDATIQRIEIALPHEGDDSGWQTLRGIYAIGPMRRLALQDSRLAGAQLHIDGSVVGLRAERNVLERGSIGAGAFANVTDALICGNDFRHGSVRTGNAANVTVYGNRFDGASLGVVLGPTRDLRFEGNTLLNHTWRGLWTHGNGPTLLIRGNVFEGNKEGAFLPSNGTDARHNWWGHASGPSGIGPGSGDPLTTLEGRAPLFEPWLTQRPELVVGCP